MANISQESILHHNQKSRTGQPVGTDLPDLSPKWKRSFRMTLSGGQTGGAALYGEQMIHVQKENLSYQDQIRFFQSTYDLIPIGLAMIDRQSGRILWKNRQFLMLLGNDDVSAWSFIFSSDQMRQEQMHALDAGQIDCYTSTKPYTDANGRQGWLKIRISPCSRAGDPGICHILIIEDISDYKKADQELTFLKYHDELTRLHNRSYFDLAKKTLDQACNLPLSYIVCDINGLKLINETISYAAGDKLLLETSRILSECCRKGDVLARTSGDEFCLLLPKTSKQKTITILNQITAAVKTSASLHTQTTGFLSLSLGYATKEYAADLLDQIIKDAEIHLIRQKLFEQKSLHSSLLASIKATMHEKSFETKEHGERMAQMARTLGRSLGLSDSQLQDLELLANVHDIGKIIIDDKILNKPGKLNDEEWLEMKKHPEIGYRIALASPDIKHIADSILFLHERWDGNGYPQGLTGEHIPVFSRILAIVDAFDAMTNDRTYRKAMNHSDALSEIRRNAGTQFDPVIADYFIQLLGRFSAGDSSM
jgi:diguanylate cyclase (GGDEF)-like protein